MFFYFVVFLCFHGFSFAHPVSFHVFLCLRFEFLHIAFNYTIQVNLAKNANWALVLCQHLMQNVTQ